MRGYFLANDESVHGFGTGSGPGRGIDFTGVSTMTGNVIADASDMVWTDTSNWLFDIGSSGVNNSIAGTGDALFDGMFTFDLTGASSGSSDTWQLTDVATQTFGANFSVDGFTQAGPFWSDGTYTFSTTNGELFVGSVNFEQWAVDADGNFSNGANWVDGTAPAAGADILFGEVITANRVVTLDTDVNANTLFFNNAGDGDYFLRAANDETLTLSGAASVDTVGRHWIQAEVTGSAGLNVSGGGEVVLDHANSFTGDVSVEGFRLSVTEPNAIPSGANVELVDAGANLLFGGDNGFFVDNGAVGGGYIGGTVNGVISGDGTVIATLGAEVTLTGANTYLGTTTVEGTDTILTLSGGGTLGASDGTAATRTIVTGEESTSQVRLVGGVNVGSEVLELAARQLAASDAAHLSSAGNNSWAGNIKGVVGGFNYNIESTSGTLTLGGVISAPDSADTLLNRNVVFSGDGDINITGRITDGVTDAAGVFTEVGEGANVNVIKRGSGTVTVGTNADNDYWFGNTTIEEGSLVITANGSSDNELFSSVTTVRDGATLDVSSFAGYDLGEADQLAGGGTIQAQTLNIYDDNVVSPGDGVGALTVNGNVTLTGGFGGGAVNVELGSTTAVGDRVQVNGAFTTSSNPAMTVRVTPVNGTLQGNGANYAIINHDVGAAANVSGFTTEVVDNLGEVLDPRQTLSVNSTTSQVRLAVNGTEANLTWSGANNGAWNVNTSNNWNSQSSDFHDLDTVTFASGGGSNIEISETVTPGSTTFSTNKTYTFTGEGGITGYGAVNVNAGTVQFQNAGNDYLGATAVASGARLEMGNASTGEMVVNGTLSVGQSSLPTVQGFVYLDATSGAGGNTTLTDGSTFTPSTNPDWEIRTGFANDGQVYQGGTDTANPNEAPVLLTTITGLAPGSSHEVYVNFWDADGSTWRILAGSTEGSLTLFDSPLDEVAGATDGIDLTTLNYGATPLITEGNRTMYGASLGALTADANGEIAVFIDESGTADGDDRTWYDGVSFSTDVLAGESLTINGDLTLASTGTLELNLGTQVSDSLSVTGQTTLDGTISVDFFGDSPANGTQYTLLSSVGGILTPLENLDFGAGLPANFTASYNAALTDLLLTFNAGLPGDFNNDGFVNAADYTVWRNNLGSDFDLNGNGDETGGSANIVDAADYQLWRQNFGATSENLIGASNSVVPEPATCLLLGVSILGLVTYRRKP